MYRGRDGGFARRSQTSKTSECSQRGSQEAGSLFDPTSASATPNSSFESRPLPKTQSLTEEFDANFADSRSRRVGRIGGTIFSFELDCGTDFGPTRKIAASLLVGTTMEVVMFIIIAANFFFLIHLTDTEAKCYPKWKDRLQECPHFPSKQSYVKVVNSIFLGLYCTEAVAKLIVFRLEYFKHLPDLADFLICVVGLAEFFLGDQIPISWINALRCARILKGVRLASTIHEIRVLMVGFLGAMRALVFGMAFTFGMMLFLSIFIVQYVHPVNAALHYSEDCERCNRGFETVLHCTLTLFQTTIAGDSWGTMSIPVIEASPEWGALLIISQCMIGVATMNLILAVIVDHAAEAREAHQAKEVHKRAQLELNRKLGLLHMIQTMDTNGDGMIGQGEVRVALDESVEFRSVLTKAGVNSEELMEIFDIISSEGNVSFKQFCEVLDDMTSGDIRKLAVFTHHEVRKLGTDLENFRTSLEDTFFRHETMLQKLVCTPSPNSEAKDSGKSKSAGRKNGLSCNGEVKKTSINHKATTSQESIDKWAMNFSVPFEKIVGVNGALHCEGDLKAILEKDGDHKSRAAESEVARDILALQQKMSELSTCTQKSLSDVLHQQMSELSACMQSTLQRAMDLHGSTVQFELGKHLIQLRENTERRLQLLFDDLVSDLRHEAASLDFYFKLFTLGSNDLEKTALAYNGDGHSPRMALVSAVSGRSQEPSQAHSQHSLLKPLPPIHVTL